jgi:hypothetical protein
LVKAGSIILPNQSASKVSRYWRDAANQSLKPAGEKKKTPKGEFTESRRINWWLI